MTSTYPPLTRIAMMEQLVRLNDMWPRWDTDDRQFERLVESYREHLSDLDAEAVAGGVGIWLKTSTTSRWPTPAQVRECAGTWLRANRDLTRRVANIDGMCGLCRSAPGLAVLRGTDRETGETWEHTRFIWPCDESKHPDGTHFVPFPPTFIRWAEPHELLVRPGPAPNPDLMGTGATTTTPEEHDAPSPP